MSKVIAQKQLCLKAFGNHFLEWMDWVCQLFPNDVDMEKARTALTQVKKYNPKGLITLWYRQIYNRYKTQIDNEDFGFFVVKEVSKENIEYAKKDYFLLDANRSFIENSFDFSIETIGVYSNEEIFKKACIILIENFNDLKDKLQSDSVIINSPITTIKNCYEVVLENIDHTIGKVLEFILNELYFTQKELLTYIGFTKKHPHDLYSIIKMAFPEPVEKSVVRDYILSSIEEANRMYSGLLSSMK